MAAADTKGDLLRCLDRMTRELSLNTVRTFTTARIAQECHVSRNLASQYLNELVHDGLVVKIGGRPVLFLHRAGAERYFERTLDQGEYPSLNEFLQDVGMLDYHDFERAIGYDLSLSVCVERLKSAVRYPPDGLPVLLVGPHGTGKELLAHLAFQYGVNSGVLPAGAQFVKVDCSDYGEGESALRSDVFGAKGHPGAVQRAAGGIVFLKRIDHLSRSGMQAVVNRVMEAEHGAGPSTDEQPARFILATSRPADHSQVAELVRMLPIVVNLPRYVDRTEDERLALVMHYLRVEGRRVASDASISRGALRTLVEADFDENIDGLRACITDCCANAYLNNDDGRLCIRSYNLPLQMLGSTAVRPDDDQLVPCDKKTTAFSGNSRMLSLLQRLVDVYESYQAQEMSFDEFLMAAVEAEHVLEDYRNFDAREANPRVATYEQVLMPLVDEVNDTYGIELSHKAAHSLAQLLAMQLWGGAPVIAWRKQHQKALRGIAASVAQTSRITSSVVEQLALRVKAALGIEFDELTYALQLVEVKEAVDESTSVRDALGVVLCHGYATATSIADAANRILGRRVFEAIDMTYDQEVSDVVAPLTRILDRFSYVSSVALLVDMGSLAQIATALPGIANGTLYVVNNVSTGLALEVGAALVAHEDLGHALEDARDGLVPQYRVIEGTRMPEAVVFCSEAGQDAADKIKRLVQESLPEGLPLRLVTCDYHELQRLGDRASVFGSYRVRAIVGTMNPGVSSVPFVALEDILYQGSSDVLDAALARALGPDGLPAFHERLLRNVTLRSVAESITILNPEMLYLEADRAMKKLARLSGEAIDSRRQIALYVHLCGLIERLITHNFVDTYPDVEEFEAHHQDFIGWFREAFDDMSRRYKVQIPVSEIGYVYHMLHTQLPDTRADTTGDRLSLQDE